MNTYVIAEIGINHNGDLNLAKELISLSKENGCQAVKFQKRDVESVYSQEELESWRESPWGTTFREQKEGLEFTIDQYKDLESYTKSLGLDFIVSCWDLKSLDLIENNCNVSYHKIASAMLTDREFLEKINETKKPVIVSTGMSTEEEIEKALSLLNNVSYILACTSTYPTNEKEVNLLYVQTLKKKYPNYKIGFSNHSSGLLASLSSIVLGAECLEFHITKDRAMYGSDQAASIENVEKLMSGIQKIEDMLGDGIKKVYESEVPIIKKLRKKNNL